MRKNDSDVVQNSDGQNGAGSRMPNHPPPTMAMPAIARLRWNTASRTGGRLAAMSSPKYAPTKTNAIQGKSVKTPRLQTGRMYASRRGQRSVGHDHPREPGVTHTITPAGTSRHNEPPGRVVPRPQPNAVAARPSPRMFRMSGFKIDDQGADKSKTND